MVADRLARGVRLLAVMISVVGCRETDGQRTVPSRPVPPLSEVSSPGRIEDKALREASGLVRSTREANVFWAQGDSGNEPVVLAFDSTGRALRALLVRGATNRDWEALALGPCAETSCLYIGDVGDNLARRDDVSIWRIPEPRSRDTVTPPASRLVFRYPEGARDVEAMWVTPDTSVYLLTKRPQRDGRRWRATLLYRLSAAAWQSSDTVTAQLVDSLPIVPARGDEAGWITDASFSDPDSAGSRRLAVRTYGLVYVFDVDAVTYKPTSLTGKCSLAALAEKRSGEGVTWLADGRLLFNHEGAREPLFAGRCP